MQITRIFALPRRTIDLIVHVTSRSHLRQKDVQNTRLALVSACVFRTSCTVLGSRGRTGCFLGVIELSAYAISSRILILVGCILPCMWPRPGATWLLHPHAHEQSACQKTP